MGAESRRGNDPGRGQKKERRITSREVKTIEYPHVLTKELIEEWADGIPLFSEADPKNPEWLETPTQEYDLRDFGFGIVSVKMESDTRSNPTGTMKDRPAWEFACGYRDLARRLYLKMKRDPSSVRPKDLAVPRFSVITSGNEGMALAYVCQKYHLPPPKLLMDAHTPADVIQFFKEGAYAEVYLTNLSKKQLSFEDINALTKNKNGIDLTSLVANDPAAVFYDWHVHEVFNTEPTRVYLPYGSGRLMDNYLFWQHRTGQNLSRAIRDPRLRIDPNHVIDISIIGVEPEAFAREDDNKDDKAVAPYKPFTVLDDNDRAYLRIAKCTGKDTKVRIGLGHERDEAFEIFQKIGIEAEPTAAWGLAMYMREFRDRVIRPNDKVLIINTGKGLPYKASERGAKAT